MAQRMTPDELKQVTNLALLRPFLRDGESWVTIAGNDYPSDLSAKLTAEEWAAADRIMRMGYDATTPVTQMLQRLCCYGGFNGLAKTTLEQEEMTDPGEAIIDDGPTDLYRGDRPIFRLYSLSLPITHADVFLGSGRLSGQVEYAGEAVGRMVEGQLLGEVRKFALKNLCRSFEEAYRKLREHKFYGPYAVFKTPLQECIVLQATHDVFRVVVGQEPILVQWRGEKDKVLFKVLAIVVMQCREVFDGSFGGCLVRRS